MDFIKEFYETTLTEQMYQNYLQGLIIKKSQPYKDIYQESSNLIAGLKDYHSESGQGILWHRRAQEKQILQNEMTFSLVKERYQELLLSESKRRMVILRTFPSKHFDLAMKTDFEENFTNMDDKVR